MFTFLPEPVPHTRDHPCPVCRGHSAMPKGRRVRCAGMTGDIYVWCTREEYAGNALLDLKTSPPTFRHSRHGWCPCGQEHGHSLPRPEFDSYLRLVPHVVESPSTDELSLRHEVYEYTLS